jgi:hypothetical protein
MSYLQQRLSSHYQIDTVKVGSEKGLTGVKVTAYYQRLLNNVFKYRHAFHHFEDYLSMHLGNSVNVVADSVKWRCMIETYKLAGQNVSTNDILHLNVKVSISLSLANLQECLKYI